jgi:RNA recognition motif-containing protein
MMRLAFLLLAATYVVQAWAPTGIQQPYQKQSTRLEERRFAQPRPGEKYGSDSKLASVHKERLKTAGRKGTKRFVDPCKVFVGNLPFSVDEKKLEEFMLGAMGQTKLVLHSSKVIYEWKTGKSKGYGFLVFTDPIYATVCMETCQGKMLDGRGVNISQGKKKEQDNQLYINKKRKAPETEEDAAISSGLEEAESGEEDIPVFGGRDDDMELDAVLFGLLDDDDDGEDDGVFLERPPIYEDMDPDLNREKRREAARRLKKKKPPHKGFGPVL